MQFSNFPRVSLAHLPTPLEYLPRLSEHLGGPDIYVKRDDCTGLATGGNKTRKLEFSMGEALQQGADTIITVGAVQSNHVRQTAAAACKLGLKCEVLLEHRVTDPSDTYANSGNVFLDRIFGANLREYAGGTDFDAAIAEVEEEIRAAGGTPYIIPGGASNPVGALGYVGCGIELLQQFEDQKLSIDHVVTATGSAGTHAGLAVGLRGSGSDIPILGIGVNAPQDVQEEGGPRTGGRSYLFGRTSKTTVSPILMYCATILSGLVRRISVTHRSRIVTPKLFLASTMPPIR